MDDKNKKTPKVGGVFRVFRELEPALRRVIRKMMPSGCEVSDLTQETILRALAAERKREIEQPRAYLYSIARNVVRDELDKKSRSIIDFIDDYAPELEPLDELDTADRVDEAHRLSVFTQAVASLPSQCRQVFVLKKVYGHSHKEVSKKLGISISTTEKHTVMGLKRCEAFMKRHLDGGFHKEQDSNSTSIPHGTQFRGRS